MTNRALRLLELFGTDASITEAESTADKFDPAYSDSSAMAAPVRKVRAAAGSSDSLLQAAIDQIST